MDPSLRALSYGFEPSFVYSPKVSRMEHTIIKPRDCMRCKSALIKSYLRQKIWFCSRCGLYSDDAFMNPEGFKINYDLIQTITGESYIAVDDYYPKQSYL